MEVAVGRQVDASKLTICHREERHDIFLAQIKLADFGEVSRVALHIDLCLLAAQEDSDLDEEEPRHEALKHDADGGAKSSLVLLTLAVEIQRDLMSEVVEIKQSLAHFNYFIFRKFKKATGRHF